MKIRLIILIIGLIFTFQACNSSIKHDNKTIAAKNQSSNFEKRLSAIRILIEKESALKFPLRLDVLSTNKTIKDTLITDNPILGFFPDTTIYYGFLTLSIGDLLYPTIETYDKKGSLIQSEIISTSNCIHPVADIELCYDSIIISLDYKIFGYSKLIGSIEDFNDTSDNPASVKICRSQTSKGEILENGNIVLEKSVQKDCLND